VISVPNERLLLKPGMTATVTIDVAHRENVLRLPNAAVRFMPSAEMFTALGQPVPQAGGGRAGTRPAGANASPASSGAETSPRAARPGTGAPGAHTRGRIWRLENGKLVPVPVQLGLADAAFTEVVGGPVAEGTLLVTGASVAQAASNDSTARSPLLPQFPRRGGGGTGSSAGGRR
jgi:HlyD family secretion protein